MKPVLLIIALAIWCALFWCHCPVLWDDAYISLRYAWNLAHGLGPVWNAGERVEGYTNPLWVAVMAAGCFGGKDGAVIWTKIAAGLLLAGAAIMAGTVAVRIERDRRSFPMGMLAVLLCAPLLYWSMLGMESALACYLLLGCLLCVGRPAACGTFAGLAYLARPDMAVCALPVLALCGRRQWRGWLIAAGIIALHVAWRRSYYGEWLPNTYTLKVDGTPLATRLVYSVPQALEVLKSTAPLWILAALGAWPLALLPAVYLAYFTWSGGDAFGPWRLPSVVMPLLILAALPGMRRLGWHGPWRLALLALCLAPAFRYDWPHVSMRAKTSALNIIPVQIELGRKLGRALPPESRVAVAWAGAIPYYSGLHAVDLLGKCDKHVARRPPDLGNLTPGHNKYDLAYSLLRFKPAYIQTARWYRDDYDWWCAANGYRSFMDGGYTSWIKAGAP